MMRPTFGGRSGNLGYEFGSLHDKVPEGPMRGVFEALIEYSDQQHLINLSIDVKRGLRDLVKFHGWLPGVPPRGMMREKVIIGQRRDGSPHIAHCWIPDPEKASLVKRAYQMRAAGASLGEIHKETHLYGAINSYTDFWPRTIYYGTLTFADLVIENYCDPIVDKETWDKVKQIQAKFRQKHNLSADNPDHPRRRNSRFMLSGLARCGRCGSPLYGHSSKQRNGSRLDSYLCTRAYRNRDCTRQRIPSQHFEKAVLHSLREFLQKETLDQIAAELSHGQADRLEAHQIQI
jgi:site-specific DNA recombinase